MTSTIIRVFQFKKVKLLLLICIILASTTAIFVYQRTPIEEVKTVTIGTSASLTASLLIVAEDKKYFSKFGLKAKLKIYPSAGDGLSAMLNDNISISAVAETPIMFSGLGRNDFRVFATILSNRNDPKIVVRTSKVKADPQDLTGKIIGTTKIGQSAHFFLYLFLLRNHISMDAVTIVHDEPSVIVEKLENGVIHAASLFEPYAAEGLARLKEHGSVLSEPGLYSKTFNLVAKTDFLNTHPEIVKKVLQALISAENFCLEHPDQLLGIITKRLNIHQDTVKKYFEHSNLEVRLFNSLVRALTDEAEWATKYGLTPYTAIPDYSDYLYPQPLKSLKPEGVTIY